MVVWGYMRYSLNSLKGGHKGDFIGNYYRGYYGDTRSLDYSSYRGYVGIMENKMQTTILGYIGFRV